MADYGKKIAEKSLNTIDRKLRSTYKQTEKQLKEKLSEFTRNYEQKNKEMLKDLAEGLITKEDYQNWLDFQIFHKQVWEDKIKQVQQVLLEHKEQSMNVVRDGQVGVFMQNYNYFANKTKGITGVSFTMYDKHSVARLIKRKPQLLPKWKIDKPKEYKWSAKKVQAAIKQGIIQGESIDKITKRLAEQLASQDRKRMELFARTAITESENAGRMEMLHDAEKMGIKVRKKWLATNDNRTRDSHAEMDCEEVDVDEEFSNGLMYPGDPSGDPSEVYNCRCTMIYVYPDFE
jgi:SPP1 gp7 family putative phage head morphogenesis protein